MQPITKLGPRRRTPAFITGLAKSLASARGDIERLGLLIAELEAARAKAQHLAAACEDLLLHANPNLDLSRVAPVQGRYRYGQYGDLRNAVRAHLKRFAGQEVTTTEVAVAMQAKFSIDFPTPKHRKNWVNNSLGGALNALVKSGMVERLHERKPRGTPGRWRWVDGNVVPLSVVKARVEAAGRKVVQCDADDDGELLRPARRT